MTAARRAAVLTCIVVSVLLAALAPGADARPQARIINGTQITTMGFASDWPFLVALVKKPAGSSNYADQFCGGSLIGGDWVLTAAHCMFDTGGTQLTTSQVAVLPGSELLSDTNTNGRIDVDQLIVHPAFNNNDMGSDVALLHLTSTPGAPASTVSIVQPADAALWTPGSSLHVAGWGNTDAFSNNGYPTNAYEATVPIASDAACDGSAAVGGYGADVYRGVMMCAGIRDTDGDPNTTNGKDTCQGDSGGPGVVLDGGMVPHQVTITSWGVGCASTQFGVYTRVDAMRPWIEQETTTGDCAGAPDAVSALAFHYTSATAGYATWTPPATGCVATSYRVRVNGAVDLSGWNGGPYLRLSNLPRNTRWVIGITPRNGATLGTTERTVVLADTVGPGKVGKIYGSSRRTKITVNWTRASDPSGIGSYHVLVTGKGYHKTYAGSSSARSHVFKGLRGGRRYTVTVWAVDRYGNAGAKLSAHVRTPR